VDECRVRRVDDDLCEQRGHVSAGGAA
jgi:hypothetical protein